MRPVAGAFLLGVSLLAASEVAAQEPLRPPLWTDADIGDIPEPSEREISELFGILYNSWLRHLDLATMHTHRVALNVNAWDEVPDSSWFTNRIGLNGITGEALRAGVAGQPPEAGVWEVQELKTEGYTVGFQILDAANRRYVLKFDRPESPERNSAAEKIGSLIMHAAGYNVPHYSIVYFRGSDLVVGEDAMFEDEAGRERPMEPADLEAALASLTVGPDGRYRGNASLFLTGVPKGPFSYSGTRPDDPNDIIPHELRREIRGFRVLASWFNHVDVKEANTFDAYVTDGDRHYIRHNFIDFGSTMGSGDFVNGPCRVGYAYIYDGAAFAKSLATLGVWERPWDASCDIPYPEVGRFEGEFFRCRELEAKLSQPRLPGHGRGRWLLGRESRHGIHRRAGARAGRRGCLYAPRGDTVRRGRIPDAPRQDRPVLVRRGDSARDVRTRDRGGQLDVVVPGPGRGTRVRGRVGARVHRRGQGRPPSEHT